MPESPSSEPSHERTYQDVLRDRGVSIYPRKKHDAVNNGRDRRDFLVAAYAVITHLKPELFKHLLSTSLYSRRIEYIKHVLKISTELSLMSILAKVISFDKKQNIIIPTDIQLDDILREMQAIFEPETIRVREILPPEIVPERLSGPGTFLGRPITNVDILSILESLPIVEPEPAKEPAPAIIQHTPRREKPSFTSVTQPVSARVSESIKPKRPAPPLAPRRGDKPQHPGHRIWEIPKHVKEVLANKSAEAPQILQKKPSLPELPEFSNREEALAWLRNQHLLRQKYREALEQKDDLALFAFIRPLSPFLARSLISIRNAFGYISYHDILRGAFEPGETVVNPSPVIIPVGTTAKITNLATPPSIPPVPQSPSAEKEQIDLTPAHEKQIQDVFTLHITANYAGFLSAVQSLPPDIAHEVEQIRSAFSHSSIFHAIAYIAGADFTAKDNNLYVSHNWYTRIRKLPSVDTNLKTLLNLGKDANKMSVIERKIGNIRVRVPSNLRDPWHGFDEIHALERPLIEVIQSLIKTVPGYKRDDEKSTKKILRTIKQIMGDEPPEAAE